MSLPIKLTIGGLGVSAVVIPGAWMAITAEPGITALSSSPETVKEYENKFGGDFRYHLVDAKEGKNQSWWDWSFKYRWSKEEGSDFSGVTSGSSLRAKCEEAYKKDIKTDVHADGKESYEKDVWRYCSLEGQKPIILSEADGNVENSSDGKIKTAKKKDLISITDHRNSKFWEIQEKAFFGEGGLGSKATEESSIFKKLYSDTPRGSLKDTCQEAYDKNTSDTNIQKDSLLFCSLLIRES